MTNEETRFRWIGKKPAYRPEQTPGIPTGKVSACSAEIGHEKRVAHKDRIADLIGQVRWGVAERRDRDCRHPADTECFTVGKQMIEVTAIRRKVRSQIKNLLESLLNLGNLLPDGRSAAQLVLEIVRGRQMIGVRMRFKDPFRLQSFFADEGDYPVC